MSTKLKAGTSTSGAVLDADTTGILELQSGSTPTTAVTIDASQNVGIGTANPATKLTVKAATNVNMNFNTGNTASNARMIALNDAGSSLVGMELQASTHAFLINATDGLRIDSSGNVKINSTSSGDGAKFIVANTGLTGCSFQQATAGNACAEVVNSGGGGTNYLFSFRSSSGGSNLGAITHNGTNVTYSTSSDYRLKENILPMTGALDKVSALKPVTYDWKNGGSSQGFIAHELQAVVPECVTGEKDAVDAEGKPVYQGIDTSFLVATLTAAIQELNAKVDAQAAEIKALKGVA